MSVPVTAFIGLGSNVGDRRAHIETGVQRLDAEPDIDVIRVSPLIETDPVGPGDQGRYLNAAAELRTTRDARALLDTLLDVERRAGRDRRGATRWGARTLDLDLLLYGAFVINEPGLVVPHARMHERSFVLVPLAEIAGSVVHPVRGETIDSLLRQAGSHGIGAAPGVFPLGRFRPAADEPSETT